MPDLCLGDGVYSARFVRRRTRTNRGGAFLTGQAPPLISGSWNRRFGQSTAGATFAITQDCCGVVSELLDLAVLEVEMWRQSTRNDLVWAGPVTDLVDNRDGTMTIAAVDQSLYAIGERRARPGSWTQQDLSTVFVDVLRAALAEDDPGLVFTATPTGILGDRVIADTDVVMVSQVIDEISRTAVDWTVIGREWRVGGTEVDLSRTLPVRLRDLDFVEAPKLRVSRSAMGTRWYVRASGDVVGAATYTRPDGVIIERSIDGAQIIDQGSADAAAATALALGKAPVVVIDGTQQAAIAPGTEVDIQTLVPGMGVPVDVGDCLRYTGTMRLAEVAADFTAESESVKVTLQPVGTGSL